MGFQHGKSPNNKWGDYEKRREAEKKWVVFFVEPFETSKQRKEIPG